MDRSRIAECLRQERKRGLLLLTGLEWHEELRERLLTQGGSGLLAEMAATAEVLLQDREPELPFALFQMFAKSGERLPYERVYFARRLRLNSFAVMAFLKPEDERYLHALCDTVWAMLGEVTWCLPAHAGGLGKPQEPIDLFAAETGSALCELDALLGERLPEVLRRRIAQETERRLFTPFMEQGPYGWESNNHNWSAVCAGGIGMAALYTMEDNERLAILLERVLSAMDCFLSGYGDDGACAEGYGYWQYGFGYFVYFAEMLRLASSGAINLFLNDKVKAIALFQQKIFTDGPMIVNFSDAPATSGIFMGLSSCLHAHYSEFSMPDPSLRANYTDDHCARWAPAIRNMVWGVSAEESGRIPLWPAASYYLPNVQWLHSRVAADGLVVSFAAKGGCNDEPHNHNDVGHFLIHAAGEAFLADLGSGEYTADYFGEGRYQLWCNGSQGHSVPIIGGCCQEQGGLRRAKVIGLELTAKRDVLELDLTQAYAAAGLQSLTRRFVLSKGGESFKPPQLLEPTEQSMPCGLQCERYGQPELLDQSERSRLPELKLTDSYFLTHESIAVTERFISLLEPDLVKPGLAALHGRLLTLRIIYDDRMWSVAYAKQEDRDHFGRERVFYTLDFHAREVRQGRLEGSFYFQFVRRQS